MRHPLPNVEMRLGDCHLLGGRGDGDRRSVPEFREHGLRIDEEEVLQRVGAVDLVWRKGTNRGRETVDGGHPLASIEECSAIAECVASDQGLELLPALHLPVEVEYEDQPHEAATIQRF